MLGLYLRITGRRWLGDRGCRPSRVYLSNACFLAPDQPMVSASQSRGGILVSFRRHGGLPGVGKGAGVGDGAGEGRGDEIGGMGDGGGRLRIRKSLARTGVRRFPSHLDCSRNGTREDSYYDAQ